MKSRLRPMGVGAILDNSFTILRERFWAFQGVNAISMLPASIIYGIILVIYFTVGGFGETNNLPDLLARNSISFVFMGLLSVIYLIAAVIGSAYMTYGNIILFSDGLHNRKIPFREIFTAIQGKRGPYIGMILLISLASFLLMIPALLIMIDSVIWGIVAFLLSIIAIVLLMFYFHLAPIVLFLEDKRVFAALQRAFHLMAKYRWRIFGIYVLMYFLWGAMFGGFYILAILTGVFIALQHIIAYVFAGLFAILAVLAFNTLYSFFYGPVTAVYYDLLIRKEGYDIQQQLAEEDTGAPSLSAERSMGI